MTALNPVFTIATRSRDAPRARPRHAAKHPPGRSSCSAAVGFPIRFASATTRTSSGHAAARVIAIALACRPSSPTADDGARRHDSPDPICRERDGVQLSLLLITQPRRHRRRPPIGSPSCMPADRRRGPVRDLPPARTPYTRAAQSIRRTARSAALTRSRAGAVLGAAAGLPQPAVSDRFSRTGEPRPPTRSALNTARGATSAASRRAPLERRPESCRSLRSHLVKHFARGKSLFRAGTIVKAVDDVSFAIDEGTFGLVGESGAEDHHRRCMLRLISRLPLGAIARNAAGFARTRLRQARRRADRFRDPLLAQPRDAGPADRR